MTVENMDEGDIFSWCYADEDKRVKSNGWTTTYWCKSRVAIFKDGRLSDTYWYSGSENSHIDLDRVVLTFLGNPKAMKQIHAGDRVFYKSEDVVDLSHPNNSGAPVYVKAERDAETMRQYYREQAERFQREEKMAQDRMADCRNAIASIDRGELSGIYFPVYL